jgi:hypothetical protein
MMSTNDADEIVRLVTADNPTEAHIWEQALLAEGIRCKVVGEFLDAGIGDISGLRPEIWVRREDVPRAEAVLRREIEGEAGESSAEESER